MQKTKVLAFGLALAAATALVPQTASARGWHGGWRGGGWGWGAAALGAGLAAGALAAPYYGYGYYGYPAYPYGYGYPGYAYGYGYPYAFDYGYQTYPRCFYRGGVRLCR
jgi:hypothetical protein